MQRNRATEVRVGIFVFVALLIGSILIFTIGSRRNLFASKVSFKTVFSKVNGLKRGGPVRLAGVDVGSVGAVDIGQDGRIHVTLNVTKDAARLIRTDSLARMASKGLLGDGLVDISAGFGKPIPEGGRIPSEDGAELSEYMRRAGNVLNEVEGTAKNLRAGTSVIAETEFQDDIRNAAHNLSTLLDKAAKGQGPIGAMMSDAALTSSLKNTLSAMETLSRELSATSKDVRAITTEIKSGNGFAHELLYGKEGTRFISRLADASGELAQLLNDVRTGDGAAHELLYGKNAGTLIDNLNAITADLRVLTSEAKLGKGTLGALMTDPSLYEDMKRLVGNLERNDVLRALVRYSIKKDETKPTLRVTDK